MFRKTKPATRYVRVPHLDHQRPHNTRDAWAWEDLTCQTDGDDWSAHVYVWTQPNDDPNRSQGAAR